MKIMRLTAFVLVSLMPLLARAQTSQSAESKDRLSEPDHLVVIRVPTSYLEQLPSREEGSPMLFYKVEVLKVLKGSHKVGETPKLGFTHALAPGARYLLPAGMSVTEVDEVWPSFFLHMGAVEIPRSFDLAKLDGKDPEEQVSAILSARRKDILRKMEQLEQEKKILDSLLSDAALHE